MAVSPDTKADTKADPRPGAATTRGDAVTEAPAPTAPADVVADADDPRSKAAEAESQRQAAEAAAKAAATEASIIEPVKQPPPEVVELLGNTAKATGMLRIASVEGSGKRLQGEWSAGGKAAWVDVPSVLVAYLPEPAPATEA
jgi:hypothetical protein